MALMIRHFALLVTLLAAFVLAAPAHADSRLSQQVARTSQCQSSDWGYPCAWVNVGSYAPAIFRTWTAGSWGLLTVHNRDTGEALTNLSNIAIPDYAAQGPWHESEEPTHADYSAVFVDRSSKPAKLCEVWNFEWPWWMGPTGRWGGCMPLADADGMTAFPWPLGARASGLPFYNGVITVKEYQAWLARGAVPAHPLQVMVPLACKTFRLPANRTDGGNWADLATSDCIEYGTLFKLPKAWKPNGTIWSPLVRLEIQMAKKGGLLVVDQTGYNVSVQVENPARKYAQPSVDGWSSGSEGTADPYGFGWDDLLMRQFPWSALFEAN